MVASYADGSWDGSEDALRDLGCMWACESLEKEEFRLLSRRVGKDGMSDGLGRERCGCDL